MDFSDSVQYILHIIIMIIIINIIILLMSIYIIERSVAECRTMLVLLLVLVLAGAAVSPYTTQPRSPPCLPALPPSRLTLHTVSVSQSLGLSEYYNFTQRQRQRKSELIFYLKRIREYFMENC